MNQLSSAIIVEMILFFNYYLSLCSSQEGSAAAAIASRTLNVTTTTSVSESAPQIQSPVDRLKALKARRTLDAGAPQSGSAAATIGSMSLEQLRARVSANSAQQSSEVDFKENSSKSAAGGVNLYISKFILRNKILI